MRDLAGKGCLIGIAAIFGVFIGTRFPWVAGFPPLLANLISLVTALGIAWFLLSESKPRKRD